MAQEFTKEDVRVRWPAAARKAEMIEGALVFRADHAWSEVNAETARRTYPGHLIEVIGGDLVVWPAAGRTFDL
ncbi:hypothetical protein [Kitasatospora sp. NPDC001547]|uniref:hypothetical protein n=1 Tax=Kitasatospora sp. NPDC001547 TaxID=3364015 RepID=UPI0036B814C5